jgi:ribosomal protein L37E
MHDEKPALVLTEQKMANYQVLFNGEVAGQANVDTVRDTLARELGLDDRKAKQLFSGRTVVIRSQLEQHQAQAWQDKLAQFGAVCRIKDLTPKEDKPTYPVESSGHAEHTLRDITAAHLECPRCGHMQLDSSHCARCGVDLEQAFRAKHKEDQMIEKKIRELRDDRVVPAKPAPVKVAAASAGRAYREQEKPKKGVLSWFKK